MTDMISQLAPHAGRGAGPRVANPRVEAAALDAGKTRDASPPADTARQGMSAEQLEKAVSELNEHMQQGQHSLRFSTDEVSGRTIVRVVDTETDEVIRQIPSEEMLTVMHHLREFSSLSVDKEA
ncbi:MAG: flagellar protein FlaG [Gammaproteobacteria bacterium]